MVLEYKPGRMNQVADALSRKAELASMRIEAVTSITQLQNSLPERIKEGLRHDHIAQQLMEMAKEGKTRRFWLISYL